VNARYAHITRCLDLQERDLGPALASRDATRELLAHLATISSPNTGAAKALLVLSHMATTACTWIDGDLAIDLLADGDATVVELATELGGGMRERLLPAVSFRAPIMEFSRAIERVPHLIAPLVIRTKSPRRVSLAANEAVRRTTAPPPPIEIAGDSLFSLPPAAAVPAPIEMPLETSASIRPEDVDSGWED
jgi:hypothetical protein